MLDLLFVKVELGEEKLYLRITFEIIGLDLYEMEKIRNITFRSNEYVGLSTEPSSRFAAQMGVGQTFHTWVSGIPRKLFAFLGSSLTRSQHKDHGIVAIGELWLLGG